MPIIAIAADKGGVGKTTTAIALAAALHEMRLAPTLVDLDPAGHLSWGLGIEPSGELGYEILTGTKGIINAVMTSEGLPIVPAAPAIARLEGSDVAVLIRRLSTLAKRRLLVVDTPPGFTSTLAQAGIAASDLIIIAVTAEPFAANAASHVLDVARALGVSPIAMNYMVVATQVDKRRQLTSAVLGDLRKHNLPISASIPRTVKVPESAYVGKSVLRYAPTSEVAVQYRRVAREAAKRLGLSK